MKNCFCPHLSDSQGDWLTDLKDLGKVCVSVAEHGVDAVDGIFSLAGRASLGFGLQYR